MEKHFGRSEDGCLVGGSRRELGEDPSLDSSSHPPGVCSLPLHLTSLQGRVGVGAHAEKRQIASG